MVTFQYSQFSNNNNDSTLTLSDINWVNIFTSLGSTPDSRLNNTSVASIGADFTDLGSATSTISIEEKNISIYPNPSNGIFNITGYDEMLIVITDLTGRTLLTKQINKNNQIDLSNLSSGIYFITINNQETKKLVLN